MPLSSARSVAGDASAKGCAREPAGSPRSTDGDLGARRCGLAVRTAPAGGRAPASCTADGCIEDPPALADGPTTTGRLFLFVSPAASPEPRLQSNASLFGVDVRGATAGQRIAVAPATPGSPEATLADLAPGEYYVQALYNRYTEFHRADGHVIWAHMDQWEGQHFARSPGNLHSVPQKVRVGPGASAELALTLDQIIPPVVVPPDTAWVKRLKFQSPLLSKFWGRPMFLGATVLLPLGYDAHAAVRYPVLYIQNHFSLGAPFGFNPTPDPAAKKSWARLRAEAAAQHLPEPVLPPGATATGAYGNTESGHEFYESWTSADFPRFILVTFQHPTPYFDDSYGVNSPNCGPYGDALLQELIPAVETRFRVIRQGYARLLSGSSTGGWGALALQLYHPDFFGGAWAFSPDPVDFRAYYGGVNLDTDDNAFVEKTAPGLEGGGRSNRRGSQRAAVLGMEDGRFEWWKHTPAGPDGYPLPVWDLSTGRIDRAVVAAMRANNFDLRDYLARKWPEIGPSLAGKLHVHAAATDSFYSNFAVHLLEEFMQGTTAPHDPGTFRYGPPASRHGWQPTTNAELLQAMARHVAARAPAGEDPAAWRY
ncbi:MAG: alpha/beta hydrolase-fold protein [Verrucomicrobia bacterium]|nr:alpha/beta hydrolase-fold protein [Verrucomicrobiota bacterium]